MALFNACPDNAIFQGLLGGALSDDEQRELSRHLDTCAQCQRFLETLSDSEGLLPRSKSDFAARELPHKPALQKVINKLQTVGAKDQAPESTDRKKPALDFLAPAEKPGFVGRIGHYDVLEVIGHGGMGVVLKALDSSLQRVVAIKVMALQLATTALARKRFIREAQTVAAVRHEHVIDIHAVDEFAGLPYLVMEYVDGVSLQQRLNQNGPLELKEILHIGRDVAIGLSAAHAQGLIHRDVKPANILLEQGAQRVKITDFGLARAVDDATLTQSGVAAGTPEYMAPEQAAAEPVDHRADLFSLGSVLYAMCTGEPPFRAGTSMAVLRRICDHTPRPIRQINPEIPDWLVAIIDKLLAKNPADRFQSGFELAEVLGQYSAHLDQPGQILISAPRSAPARRSQRPWLATLALAMLLVAGVAVGFQQIIVRISDKDGNVSSIRVPPGASVEIDFPGREIRQFEGHRDDFWCVAVSPDGKHVVSGGWDTHLVRLWDLESGQKVRDFPGHTGAIVSVAFSPDGQRAASAGGDRTVRIWNVETGVEVRCLRGHKDSVWSVAFSPDGHRILSGSFDGTVRLWDVETGEELSSLEIQPRPIWITSVAFSPTGGLALYGCGDGTARLLDLETRRQLARFSGHADIVESVALLPDGRRFATGSKDETIRLWDLETNREIRQFERPAGWITNVAVSPDGRRILSGSHDCLMRLWDVETGKQLHLFEGHTDKIRGVAFLPDGRRAISASSDRTLRLWHLPP